MKIESIVLYFIKQCRKRIYIVINYFNKNLHFGSGVALGSKT